MTKRKQGVDGAYGGVGRSERVVLPIYACERNRYTLANGITRWHPAM